ncbi:MAG: hypothetical protein GX758_02365 [Tenericutes bacterium]|nr:hypothetical protein [Mycoplasmatota bacterium]
MDLEIYKKHEPIYIIGHSNIDIDSAVSSKILSEIFNFFDIKSYYAVLDENYDFDEYNKNMVDDCMVFEPVVVKKENITNYNWFLTDHNDRSQSVGFNANVIGCIDHHPDALNVNNKILTDVCCISLFIFSLFKDVYEFTKEQKYQIYLAFLNDSTFGKASRYKESDGVLASLLGFGSNYDELFKKFFIPTDLSNGIESKLKNGSKKYNFNGIKFESGYIERFDTIGLDEYKELINKQKSFLGSWLDYTKYQSYVYFKYDNKLKEFKYDFIASRATTVLNDVMKYLKDEKYLID